MCVCVCVCVCVHVCALVCVCVHTDVVVASIQNNRIKSWCLIRCLFVFVFHCNEYSRGHSDMGEYVCACLRVCVCVSL